jgi:hypothetical protein
MGKFGDPTTKIQITQDDILDHQRYSAHLLEKSQQVKAIRERLDKPKMY